MLLLKLQPIYDKKIPKNLRRYIIACDRHGEPESLATNCASGSRKTDCSWRANVCRTSGGWQLTISAESHNHEPSDSALSHPVLRRRNEEVKQQIRDLSAAKLDSRQILTVLRQQQVRILDRDVWNECFQWRQEKLNGQVPSEALQFALVEYGNRTGERFHFQVEAHHINGQSHLRNLFIHPKSLALLQQNPDVILLNCIYNINRFGMLFLHAIGKNALDKDFTVAFCFLSQEDEEYYTFAAHQIFKIYNMYNLMPRLLIARLALKNALTNVFSVVLQGFCRWHISKNIQSKATDAFKISSLDTEEERAHKEERRKAFLGFWSVVVSTKCASQLNDNWDKLIADMKEYPRLSNYLKSE